jgi:hypothetical protein
MAGTQWTSKRRALVISTFALAFAASLWMAAPELVPTAELLGSNWQCAKTAFVLTTCTQLLQPYTGTAQKTHDDEVTSRN